MIVARRSLLILLVALPGLVACTSGGSVPATALDGWPAALRTEPGLTPQVQQEIMDHADEILRDAAEAERWITPLLEYLTEVRAGRLEGLEHRLKGRESLIRKIYTRWNRDRSVLPGDIKIDDSVRYLLVVNDSPPGHCDKSIQEILAIMEGIGHEVMLIKNYWPRGDDYSGINGVLRAPNGTLWELQFHTDRSLEAKDRVHPIYEVYRLPNTSQKTKRDLYHQMTEIWEQVPIPDGILEPISLHPKEEIIQNPTP